MRVWLDPLLKASHLNPLYLARTTQTNGLVIIFRQSRSKHIFT